MNKVNGRARMLGLAVLWSCLAGVIQAQPGDPPPEQKGVEVLTRGPINEAFVVPLTADPRPNPIIHQKPPAPIEEIPPDEKPEGTHVQWIPGYFAWDETSNDYLWISGCWRATPPGRQWLAGHWTEADGGWQWVSGYWAAEGLSEVEYLPSPPVSIDIGPSAEAPDAESIYAPGIWVYQERRYLWRPGFWQRARPDWYYNPAHYVWTPVGCIFLDGYWDYPLERRGLLFAPARFSPLVRDWDGWRYQPRYVVANEGLYGSLFARPEFGRYYFGDYYAPEYKAQGFVPWFDHRVGKTPDPLFAYARWEQKKKNPKWEAGLRELHQERVAGTAARPPITLTHQSAVIHDIAISKTIKIGPKSQAVTDSPAMLKHMTVVAPLSKANHPEFKLQPVPKAKVADEHKAVQQIHAAAVDRQQKEIKLLSQGAHPAKPSDPPTKIKVDFPKVTVPSTIVHAQPPPAAPVIPMHVERPIPPHVVVPPLKVQPPPPKKDKEKGKGSA
jgi:hypothetical protein